MPSVTAPPSTLISCPASARFPTGPSAPDEPVDPHRIMDPLLEKISRDGLASLTRREREQLERARAVLLEMERR